MSLYTLKTAGQLRPPLDQEWLLTNGLGGFAASTVVGCNARRYHGLLCAATLPPVGRMMLLSRIGEILQFQGSDQLLEFSINQFPGHRFHPHGDQYLHTFEHGDVIRWHYDVSGIGVLKELQMPWQKNDAGLRYTITPPPGKTVTLQLLPFIAMRDFHSLRKGTGNGFDIQCGGKTMSIKEGTLSLHLTADAGEFYHQPDWWFGHIYQIETDRGLDDCEDLFNPGRLKVTIDKETTVTIWASMNPGVTYDWDAEIQRRKGAIAAECCDPVAIRADGGMPKVADTKSLTLSRLAHAANDFVVFRKAPDGTDGTTVIAGYPWFADWGRDTMISLPGLLLSSGRFRQARQVLSVFAQYVSDGMIPNRFDDYTNEPHYNTVDASLWFIHASFLYEEQSGDTETFDQVLKPACRKIIDDYRKGTRYNIHMDEADGLICQGDPKTQLTWMDAKHGETAFTPRQGKPVEINALWYHALKLMDEHALAEKVAISFKRAFWISPFRGLADVVDGVPTGANDPYPRRDQSIRPNQIFAVSLPHSPLTREQQAAVVETVRRELLTPMGLRTLSRNDPGYRGRYGGNSWDRDSAYHNGTVWAWLIGAFLEGYLKVNDRSPAAKEQARRWLSPLIDILQSVCIGQIGEIYEGDPPHRSVGTFAQAWSVAEVFRLAVELEM